MPAGEPGATDDWITDHVDELLATMERLYSHATCEPVAHEFLDRMAWLPAMLIDLEQTTGFHHA